MGMKLPKWNGVTRPSVYIFSLVCFVVGFGVMTALSLGPSRRDCGRSLLTARVQVHGPTNVGYLCTSTVKASKRTRLNAGLQPPPIVSEGRHPGPR